MIAPFKKLIPPHDNFMVSKSSVGDKYTFTDMDKVKRRNVIKPLEQVRKIVFDYSGSGPCVIHNVAIDIERKEAYINIDVKWIEDYEPTAKLGDEDLKQVYRILTEESVQEWNALYDNHKPNDCDYYMWSLEMENEDRTVESHYGMAAVPENYESFKDKITNLSFVKDNQDKKPISKKEKTETFVPPTP